LMIGQTIQQELFEIVIRFRKYRFAFTADICKMYRQINIDESQHSLQQILWRPSPEDEVQSYSLKTVTYGTASAPYLATRTLQQLAFDEEQNFPAASMVTLRDLYVDDILSGADTLEKAKEIQLQLVAMLKSGGFDLHKWVSNSPQLLNQLDSQHRVQLTNDRTVKALGLTWQPIQDHLLISSGREMMKDQVVTKRSVLSSIARLYDPLGLAGPIVVTAKLLLQRLWYKQMDWDQPLDEEDHNLWVDFQSKLYSMEEIKVPRCVIPTENPKSIKLLGFCDSSSLAYGACIYIHCLNDDNTRTTTLLCAKSRVAPLKATTIPRLELCSAVLLANLVTKVHGAMQINFDQTILWTDYNRSQPHCRNTRFNESNRLAAHIIRRKPCRHSISRFVARPTTTHNALVARANIH
jgi:Pao retrotransposon peptidase